MDAALIRELLTPYITDADDRLIALIQTHLDLLLRWNQRMNLTALRTPEQIVTRHFGESLFAARHLLARASTQTVFDLGSGAGFPGFPLKYWAPSISLTLIEAHGKKATFLSEVRRATALAGIVVLNRRAETVSTQASLVTLRAVEKFDQILASASHLVAPTGRLAILIGSPQQDRAQSILPAGEFSSTPLPHSHSPILLTWNPNCNPDPPNANVPRGTLSAPRPERAARTRLRHPKYRGVLTSPLELLLQYL